MYLVVEKLQDARECWSNFVKLDYSIKRDFWVVRLIDKTINILEIKWLYFCVFRRKDLK